MKLPRIMIGAPASGSGKTLVTCGILKALMNRGLKTASFKCGPDYIDPLFHSKVIGTKSKNLDSFFTDEETIRYLFARTGKEADISIMEGVMGYYDGVGGTGEKGSSYELARETGTPTILVIPCKGMSLSIIPVIDGFMRYQEDSNIIGVILNQISKSMYLFIKEKIEKELKIKVFGYVPFVKDLVIESRHLGLIMPEEIEDFRNRLTDLANLFEETIELEEIIKAARKAENISYRVPCIPKIDGEVKIAVARDEAFCFYYQDNLELLQEIGAELIEFSPIHDKELPENADGLLLGGGYPELAAGRLSSNETMRRSIWAALKGGLPCLAECGGFMYLHEEMEDMEGESFQMVGFLPGKAYKTDKLSRFGYITLTANEDQMIARQGERIAAHEFHYFDSTVCGENFTARKPLRKTNWNCIHGNENIAAGFPHLYYYSNMNVPFGFLNRCLERRREKE